MSKPVRSIRDALLPLATSCALLLANSALAMTVNFDGAGDVAGISDFSFGAESYEVTLVDSSCISGFTGCDNATDDFTFTSEATAKAALLAFLDEVDTYAPESFFGCSSTSSCYFNLPYEVLPGNNVVGPTVKSALAILTPTFVGLLPNSQSVSFLETDIDLSTGPTASSATQNVYVRFDTPAEVPLPAALPLYMSALGFLALFRSRKGL